MSKSEEILARRARYDRVERHADAFGRVIGVKRLKPAQQIHIEEMAPGLTGDNDIQTTEGGTISIPRRAPLILAASAVEIDGSPLVFPKTRAELDARLDMLDAEGLEAIGTALGRLSEETKKESEGETDLKN